MGVETSYDQSCDESAIFCPEGARTTHFRLACYVRAKCEQPAPSKVIVGQSHDGPNSRSLARRSTSVVLQKYGGSTRNAIRRYDHGTIEARSY